MKLYKNPICFSEIAITICEMLFVAFVLVLFLVIPQVAIPQETSTDFSQAWQDLNHNYDLLDSQDVDLHFDTNARPVILYYDRLEIAVQIVYSEDHANVRIYRKPGSKYTIPENYDPYSILFTEPTGVTRLCREKL